MLAAPFRACIRDPGARYSVSGSASRSLELALSWEVSSSRRPGIPSAQTLNPAVPGGRGLDGAVFSVRTQSLLPSQAKQPSGFPSCSILRNSNTWLKFGEARLKSGWLHKGWLSLPGKQGGTHLLAEKVKTLTVRCCTGVCGRSLSCRGQGWVFLVEVMSMAHLRLKKAVRDPSLPLSSSRGASACPYASRGCTIEASSSCASGDETDWRLPTCGCGVEATADSC